MRTMFSRIKCATFKGGVKEEEVRDLQDDPKGLITLAFERGKTYARSGHGRPVWLVTPTGAANDAPEQMDRAFLMGYDAYVAARASMLASRRRSSPTYVRRLRYAH